MQMFFFFLMIRRPPRSTLFPTRRSSDLAASHAGDRRVGRAAAGRTGSHCADEPGRTARAAGALGLRPRSEEHTSELQSRQYLVCRLLLEKKKRFILISNSRSESLIIRLC